MSRLNIQHRWARLLVSGSPLLLVFALALGLRLLVWRWHEPYPLGGDEQEYFNQALTLLREHRYVELQLMRPPLYTSFLAVSIYFFDSLVQRLRLIQEIISALTIVPIYALTWGLFRSRRVALVAALLAALSYTLAANATELLTETLFLFGLTVLFWLLVRATKDEGRRTKGRSRHLVTALAGLTLGMLLLLRSVALPLLPLGALWLVLRRWTMDDGRTIAAQRRGHSSFVLRHSSAIIFILCSLLIVLPWTARNYITYGAPILIDTTGAENLWLDNDPAGREAVKRQLYALGDDRAARQRIAMQRGVAVIRADPAHFFAKSWGEAKNFFALQYFDDMRARREIWVPPPEVWLRLLLGDGLWLVLLLGGAAGLWLSQFTIYDLRFTKGKGTIVHRLSSIVNPKWLFVPWALYVFLTGVLFHVELRYRLPLYPVLLPYTAWFLVALPSLRRVSWPRMLAAALTALLLIGMTLLHRPYLTETAMLTQKHIRLWQADHALAAGDAATAQDAAQVALQADPESVLARMAQARAALLAGDQARALALLNEAIKILPDHPQARLLRGAVLRSQGSLDDARVDFAYEPALRDAAQGWAWNIFAPVQQPHTVVDVGRGLDLGYIRGFQHAEREGFRWSSAEADVLLDLPPGAARIQLRLAPGRPTGAPVAHVTVLANDRVLGQLALVNGWRTYALALPPDARSPLVLSLRSDTFRPRQYDRTSPDNRELGVMVSRVEVTQ